MWQQDEPTITDLALLEKMLKCLDTSKSEFKSNRNALLN